MSKVKDPAKETPEPINDIRALPQRFKKKLKEEPGKVVLYGLGAGLLLFAAGKAFNFDGYYGRGASIGFGIVGITFGLVISAMGNETPPITAQNNNSEKK